MCLVCPGIVPFQLPLPLIISLAGHGDKRERVEGNHLEIGPVADENENFGMCDRLEPTSTYYTDWACGLAMVLESSYLAMPQMGGTQIDNQRPRIEVGNQGGDEH